MEIKLKLETIRINSSSHAYLHKHNKNNYVSAKLEWACLHCVFIQIDYETGRLNGLTKHQFLKQSAMHGVLEHRISVCLRMS